MVIYTTKPNMVYKQEELWFPLSEDILSWDDDFHKLMLNDQLRMEAYELAIREVVRPGMTVVDVGTGTGILSKWALETGAEHVFGIDTNEKRIPQAQKRISQAGYEEKFTPIHGFSYDVSLPEKVDIVLSELLGNLGDNEDMVRILEDARERFLKPEGTMLPSSVQSYLVPVTSVSLNKQVQTQECRSLNDRYDLGQLLKELGQKNPFDMYYDAILPRQSELSTPEQIGTFRFDGTDATTYSVTKACEITQPGVFTGFKGYFVAGLSPSVTLDIKGDDISGRRTSDCWKHCYLPVEKIFEVEQGDVLRFTFSREYPTESSPFRQLYGWKGCIERDRQPIHKFRQQMEVNT